MAESLTIKKKVSKIVKENQQFMSLIVRQRVAMFEESNSATEIARLIKKKRQAKKQRQVVCMVMVPKVIKESIYIKAQVELKLALAIQEDRLLGALTENPVTYNYRVTRVDQLFDVFFYTLEMQDKHIQTLEQVYKMIELTNDPSVPEAKLCVRERFKIFDDYKVGPYITNDDLHQVELRAQNFPYHCTIQKVNPDSSIFSQRIVNEQYLTMMGVSKEMMFHHLKENKALPSPYKLGQDLKMWCDLTKISVQGNGEFDTYINTYEGQEYKCKIEQIQVFKRTQCNPNQIVLMEWWIFKLDDRLRQVLMNDHRIYTNQINYFNIKNTEEEFRKFKLKTNYIQGRTYQNPTPCGFRLMETDLY